VASGGPSGAQQLRESTEKVRKTGIWERMAQRWVLSGKGRTAALRRVVEERVVSVPVGGGGHRQ
jgi:hypothetical protein